MEIKDETGNLLTAYYSGEAITYQNNPGRSRVLGETGLHVDGKFVSYTSPMVFP